mgnify:CR=1 FL=1
MLIEEILEELPDLKIMIMEPYVLKGTATEENMSTEQDLYTLIKYVYQLPYFKQCRLHHCCN